MKGEKDTLGGFENPSNGWHALEIDDDIKFLEDKDTKEALPYLVMFFSVVEDEDEKGRRVRQSFDLSKAQGREALATILYWSKMSGPIEKNFKITDGKDLSESQWGNKYLDIEDDAAQKIVDSIIAKAPGKTFFALTKEKKGKGKDAEGNEVDRMYCNIQKLRFYGDKEVVAEMKKKAGEAPAKPEAAAASDDEDWNT